MNDLSNQGWYALEMAWSRAKYEISGHFILVVTIVAALLLLWLLLGPGVKKQGH